MTKPSLLVHGTCVSQDGRGALLRGHSGSGKSDLALRFMYYTMDIAGKRLLVADDQVHLVRHASAIIASCPDPLTGKIEVRGLGILSVNFTLSTHLKLVVDLVEEEPRWPPQDATETLLGISMRRLDLNPFTASAPLKLALALSATSANSVN